jgi:transposase
LSPHAPFFIDEGEPNVGLIIGLDIHRTFAEAVVWEDGRLNGMGRVEMTRTGLEAFGGRLDAGCEVVIEATGNAMAVARVLTPFVSRVVIANPLQVKAIAHAHVKTDKIDAGVLARLRAAGFLPEVWVPTRRPNGAVVWPRGATRS